MKEYTREELQLIFIDSFIDVEYNQRSALIEVLAGSKVVLDALKEKRELILSFLPEEKYARILSCCTKEYIDFVLGELFDRDITAVTFLSKEYPRNLLDLPMRPIVLYAKGDLSLLSSEGIAIVGSRKSLPLSIDIAKVFATDISNAGLSVISGIAEGVDKAALESALFHSGKVISVLRRC